VTQSEDTQVAAANQRFYAAFESLDVGRMEALWLRERYVCCVHPGWPPLFGWGAVMQSWQQIFANTLEMRFRLTDVQIRIAGDIAWAVLTENIESRSAHGWSTGLIQATNIYERHDADWLIVHHHGSPVVHPADDAPGQLQ